MQMLPAQRPAQGLFNAGGGVNESAWQAPPYLLFDVK